MPEQVGAGALLPATSLPMSAAADGSSLVGASSETIVNYIEKVPLFRRLPEDEIPNLAQAIVVKEFA